MSEYVVKTDSPFPLALTLNMVLHLDWYCIQLSYHLMKVVTFLNDCITNTNMVSSSSGR